MAAATTTTYTPPPHTTGRGDWDFSVPLNYDDEDDGRGLYPGDGSIGMASSHNDHSYMHGRSNGHYDNGSEPRNAGRFLNEDEFLRAPKAPALSRPDSYVSSKYDGDSVFDMYSSARTSAVPAGGYDAHRGYGREEETHDRRDEEEPSEDKWIDRDKLAHIEGNEAADYLYDVGSSKWIHKDKLERIEIHELQKAGISPDDVPIIQDGIYTPGVGTPTDGDVSFFQLRSEARTPEQRAAGTRHNVYRQFKRNVSHSRIPVASTSAHPVPQQFLERTAPLPRNANSPTGSDGDNRASITHPAARKRSHSAGSTQLLEDALADATPKTGTSPATAGPVSNPKTRPSPSKRGSSTNNTPRGSMAAKSRTRSNPQLSRPGTAHAPYSYNSTHHNNKTPEGPPPWALQGYKPDPSLPPDQQIIPTVAKKLQQEQWERDGVSASVYDREMRPLKVYDAAEEKARKEVEGQEREQPSWPLPDPSPSKTEAERKRESTMPEPPKDTKRESRAEYGLMPKVRSNTTEPPKPQIQKMPEAPTEDETKKSKMCCCVIM